MGCYSLCAGGGCLSVCYCTSLYMFAAVRIRLVYLVGCIMLAGQVLCPFVHTIVFVCVRVSCTRVRVPVAEAAVITDDVRQLGRCCRFFPAFTAVPMAWRAQGVWGMLCGGPPQTAYCPVEGLRSTASCTGLDDSIAQERVCRFLTFFALHETLNSVRHAWCVCRGLVPDSVCGKLVACCFNSCVSHVRAIFAHWFICRIYSLYGREC